MDASSWDAGVESVLSEEVMWRIFTFLETQQATP
jgi:hypothetical protein